LIFMLITSLLRVAIPGPTVAICSEGLRQPGVEHLAGLGPSALGRIEGWRTPALLQRPKVDAALSLRHLTLSLRVPTHISVPPYAAAALQACIRNQKSLRALYG